MNMNMKNLQPSASNATLWIRSIPRKIGFAAAIAMLLCASGCQLADMVRFSYANANASHQWAGDKTSTTIPFEWVDDHIILPVRINQSESLRFVLDSGAAATVILESRHTQQLPLALGAEIPISGVGDGPDPMARIVEDTQITLGDIKLSGLSVIYLPLESVGFFDTLDEVYFDGVIGAQFFERFTVAIDYDNQWVTLSEPAAPDITSSKDDKWTVLPLAIESSLPYINVPVDVNSIKPVTVKLLLDTGYRGSVSLTPASFTPEMLEQLALPQEYYSQISQGMSGAVESRVAMADAFALGNVQIKNLPISYVTAGGENDTNGLLGNELLSRFNLIIDYANKQISISPNQRINTSIRADRSGFLLRAHRLGAIVKSSENGTLAQESEIMVSDIITQLDSITVKDANLSQLKQLLSSDRDKVSACWLSSGEKRCGDILLGSRFKTH